MYITKRRRLADLLASGLIALLAACGGGGSGSSAGISSTGGTTTPPPPVNLSSAIDGVMTATLTSTGATAATITIMRGSTVLHDKGYGHLDAAGTVPLPANALMLTASIVKPVTAAAIQQLASNGKLSLSDHVFCTGTNAPCWLPTSFLSAGSDQRAGMITIRHLLSHQGGWNRALPSTGDFLDQESLVQKALALSTPPSQDDDIRYFMTKPLDFTPGTATAYSNFGYMLLGKVVALASGTSYQQYVQTQILGPLGVDGADFGSMGSRLADRDPREPNSITSLMGPSIFVPGTTALVTDGCINSPTWVSVATAVTTSKALATFAANRLISTDQDVDQVGEGVPLNGIHSDGYHSGNLPGVSSIIRQLPSGTSYAVLINKRDEASPGLFAQSMMNSIDAAISAAGY
jgi:CubicO group peptidase (beta-lactamase class C family)